MYLLYISWFWVSLKPSHRDDPTCNGIKLWKVYSQTMELWFYSITNISVPTLIPILVFSLKVSKLYFGLSPNRLIEMAYSERPDNHLLTRQYRVSGLGQHVGYNEVKRRSWHNPLSKICQCQHWYWLTIKAPRKTASENVCLCRLLNILANFSKLFFAYRQTVWTQIRLLLNLDLHCLQKWLLKSQAEDKADDNCCDWRFKG